jgi:hypothetical protein
MPPISATAPGHGDPALQRKNGQPVQQPVKRVLMLGPHREPLHDPAASKYRLYRISFSTIG